MADIVIEAETGKTSMDELRSDIDATLDRHFPPFLKRTWEGEVLLISGPGAEGTMILEAGTLKVEAKLRPPASMMRHVIEHKIKRAFDEALGGGSLSDGESLSAVEDDAVAPAVASVGVCES